MMETPASPSPAHVELAQGIFGPWGKPPDVPSQLALVVALTLLVSAVAPGGPAALAIFDEGALRPEARRRFLTISGFAAAFLSLGYIAVYLRGGPRIIDATSYFLQGRALSHGLLAWVPADPTASFRGRFLLHHDGALAGIFPPGYPLLLAGGFLVGAPMVIGPILAAGLVVATYFLARELAAAVVGADDADDARVEGVARLGALLSIASAALRYHTADTMSHAASALGVTIALASALHARRTGRGGPWPWIASGLAIGYVAATRLPSALPIGAVVAVLALRARGPRSATLSTALAMLPGILLLVSAQRIATGELFASTQRAYYAQSDGPPGCFAYGLGPSVGCINEHADYVRAELAAGFGVLAAAKTTLHRLQKHVGDIANLGPLALLCLVPLWRALRAPRAARLGPLACGAVIGGFVLVYAPFYFDGSYPGGGARFFADVLPVEHALLALALFQLAPSIAFARKAAGVLAVALAAFALHAVAWHRTLADRDGGRPMFEPDALRAAHVEQGLVFFETDHGFNLAHDPKANVRTGIVAARLRGDDHDRALYEALGRPSSRLYRLGEGGPSIVPWSPPITASSLVGWTFEAEAEWPPLSQAGGWVEPRWASGSCASGAKSLAMFAAAIEGELATGDAWLELPVPETGAVVVTPQALALGGAGTGKLELYAARGAAPPLAHWSWRDGPDGALDRAPGQERAAPTCKALDAAHVTLTAPKAFLRFRGERPVAGAGPDPRFAPPAAALDRVDVVKDGAAGPRGHTTPPNFHED